MTGGEPLDINASSELCFDAMRTTLSLDDDVAVELERLQRSRQESFKVVVNAVLREGLKQLDRPPRHRAAFHTATVDLGRFRLDNVDDIAQALSLGETDAYR